MCEPQSTKSRRFMSRPRFGRAGGRRGDARWELTAAAAGLREVTIKLHQQYESPAAVVDFVRRTWQPAARVACPLVGPTCPLVAPSAAASQGSC